MNPIKHLATPMTPWRALVNAYPESEFASGTRSTLPLLDFWQDQSRSLEVMRKELGLQLENAALLFEHQTRVGDGRGKASHTDLMIDATSEAVAVEAKFTEPQYESVAKWSGEEPTENRQRVLSGWLGMISKTARSELSAAAVTAIPYQMIHRCASACAMRRESAFVVYHLFGSHEDRTYVDHLGSLATSCGKPRSITFAVLHTPAISNPHFAVLLARLGNAEHPGALVREALLEAPLYEFGPPVLKRIR